MDDKRGERKCVVCILKVHLKPVLPMKKSIEVIFKRGTGAMYTNM